MAGTEYRSMITLPSDTPPASIHRGIFVIVIVHGDLPNRIAGATSATSKDKIKSGEF